MNPIRLFHPNDTQNRLAIISRRPAQEAGTSYVAVAVGATRYALIETAQHGPFADDEAAVRAEEVATELALQGYLRSGVATMVQRLQTSSSPRERAHIATRLGWRKEAAAVSSLVARTDKPKDDIGSIVIALGRIGDSTGKAAISAEVNRKLLSRRRAGGEAARLLGDASLIKEVEDKAKERLVDLGVLHTTDADALRTRLHELPSKDQGPAVDALYDFGSDSAVVAVRAFLRELDDDDFTRAFMWRFVKSVFKRAVLRRDAVTFASIYVRIERIGRFAKGGTVAEVKSGLDGETRATRIFSQRTADWLRRFAWRELRLLATHMPSHYPEMAAAVLIEHVQADNVIARARVPAAGHCYLLMRILHGGGKAYVVDKHRPVHRLKAGHKPPPPTMSSIAFSSLWSTRPELMRAVLASAKHSDVVAFGLCLAAEFPAIVDEADAVSAVAFLKYGAIRNRAQARLRTLLQSGGVLNLDAVLALASVTDDDTKDAAHQLAVQTVTDLAHSWTKDARTCIALVDGPAVIAEVAARLLRAALPSLTPAQRQALATEVLLAIEAQNPEAEALAIAELVELLADDVRALCDIDRARVLLHRSATGAAVAAAVIGGHKDALALLGVDEVLRLANHPQTAWRAIVATALRSHAEPFADKPGLLFELLESEWDDVRDAGLAALRTVKARVANDENGCLAVCDSTWPDVQREGQAIVTALVAEGRVDSAILLTRLAQHPHKNMRGFVLDLAEGVIGDGARQGLTPLLRLEPLLRAALFELRPQRALRRRVTSLLAARGRDDEAQGELAAAILLDVVASTTHALRDDALSTLAQLSLAWPSVAAQAKARGVDVVG